MSTALGTQTIEELWNSFKTADPLGGDEITLEGLRKVMQSLGYHPTDEELHHILIDADANGSITFEKFVALIASLPGSRALLFEREHPVPVVLHVHNNPAFVCRHVERFIEAANW